MLQIKNTLGGGGKGLYAWKRSKKKTLYDNGTQYEPLSTFQYISDSTYSPTGSTTFGSDSIVCACSSNGILQGAVTDNTIDLAGYSKISIECEISTNNAIHGAVGVSNDKITTSALKTLRVNSTDGTVRTEISYDIPSDVNNKYIVFGVQSGWKASTDNTMKVYRVWLETSEEYVIDNNPDKYPDGETHTDGYYYKKVVEGAKISTGSISNSDSSLSNLVIEHGLGKTPTKFIVMADLYYSGTSGTVGAFYNVFPSNKVIYYDYGICAESSDFTVNDTTVTVKAMTNIGRHWASKTYYWVAIAE